MLLNPYTPGIKGGSARTILKDVESGKTLEPETADALSESDMTTLRNELIQALYQTVEPSYLEALKPGVINSESIRDSGGFEGEGVFGGGARSKS